MWPQPPPSGRDGGPPYHRGGGGPWPPQGEDPGALNQFRNMQQAPQPPPPAAIAAMMALGKGFFGKGKGWPGK
ncbi:hypothetical protein FOZ63_002937, partial [Perkinsus olseni]